MTQPIALAPQTPTVDAAPAAPRPNLNDMPPLMTLQQYADVMGVGFHCARRRADRIPDDGELGPLGVPLLHMGTGRGARRFVRRVDVAALIGVDLDQSALSPTDAA